MVRVLAALIIPILILMAYKADTADAENADGPVGRYLMNEVDEGYLRLDTANGRVSFCHRKNVDWVCELIPDDRAAYEAEIAQLMEENRQLKEDVAALKRGDQENSDTLRLPNRKDMDRLMAFFDRMMRRFIDMVKSLKEEAKHEPTGLSRSEPWLPPIRPHEPTIV
ncbi:MAG: hypothetical protein Q8P46_03080 [Hyphomicrobiales bacterium]|nr:hypothetical protein [Hyphomicrobiales bacterium]